MLSRSSLRVVGGVATAAGIGGGVYVASKKKPSDQSLLVPTLQATGRALRLAQTAVLMGIDYKFADYIDLGDNEHNEERQYWEAEVERRRQSLDACQTTYTTNSHPDLDIVERVQLKKKEREEMLKTAEALAEAQESLAEIGSRRSLLHRRAAERLLRLCHDNRGVYIKVGQHLANLDYLIPQEYIEVLSALYDDNPRSDFADVQRVIKDELGADPEDLFQEFEPEPIASASLAQVHVAYEKGTGRKLAVKVQHPGLRETSAGDIFALVSVVRAAEKLFDGFTWGWLADEIAPQLPKELDFANEGRNAERAAENIAKTGLNCVIPKVIWEHSSPRVLTMEFEEGFKATDIKAIEESGLNKRDVAQLISSVFSSQIFLSSFVHCDPHPANCLLRNRNGKPQLVLVDHGLYRSLDTDFRRRYAALWKSLMLADLAGIKEACRSLGVEHAYTLFAAMLTARPFDEMIERSKKGSLRHTSKAGSKADQALIRGYAQKFIHDIFDMLSTIPRQMLLLLKMNDCLRHIDYSLGSPTNTIVICGKYAARSIYEDAIENSSFVKRLRAWLSYVHVVARIQIHDLAVWWSDALKL